MSTANTKRRLIAQTKFGQKTVNVYGMTYQEKQDFFAIENVDNRIAFIMGNWEEYVRDVDDFPVVFDPHAPDEDVDDILTMIVNPKQGRSPDFMKTPVEYGSLVQAASNPKSLAT